MRSLFLTVLAAALVPALLAPAARAQGAPSNADVTAYDAGYQTAQRMRAGSAAFTADRYREGFRAGLRGDSTQIAFALGLQTGFQLRSDTLTGLDPEAFLRGIEAGFAGSAPAYTPEVVGRAQAAFGDSLQARQARARLADPAVRTRREAAARVLSEAAARPGAVVSPTGLVSVVTTPGTGATPTPTSRVQVRYQGRFPDGTVFDETPEGQTAEFGLSGVVPGFAEALSQMKVGETRTVWLPPALAYGERGMAGPGGQGGIPPDAALVFDLTLVSILP